MELIVIAIVLAAVVLVIIQRRRRISPPALANEGESPQRAPRPILRQYGDLRLDDFKDYPVWIQCHVVDYDEPWYDETDEETFRPWTEGLPTSPEEGVLLVRAKLTLADGTPIRGFLTPQHQNEDEGKPDLGTIQPQMFLESGEPVSFWGGMRPFDGSDVRRLCAELKRLPDQVFPIRFEAEPGLTTGIASGSIPGFCFLERGGTVDVRK